MKQAEESTEMKHERPIAICQMILRVATGAILAAFVLIILMTTISTGALVRDAGKILYYVIVLAILVSLAIWFYRSRLEKRLRLSGAV